MVFFVCLFVCFLARHRAVVLQHEDDFCYLSFSPSFCLAMFPSCCHLSISKCDSCLAPKQTAALSWRTWAFLQMWIFFFFSSFFFPCGFAFNPHTQTDKLPFAVCIYVGNCRFVLCLDDITCSPAGHYCHTRLKLN